MPFCGFNKEMLNGLDEFHEGLVSHGIINRSKSKDQSIEETLERELSDMDRFLAETGKIEDPQIRELTESLARYAKTFYTLIQREGINTYQNTISFLNNFYREMDHKFYSELEGKPNDMSQLVEHLNKIKL